MSYFRPEIDAMARLRAGRAAAGGQVHQAQHERESVSRRRRRCARAIAAVLERGLARYPDPMADAFRRRAGEVLGVEPDWILCGNGSDDILTIVTRAFVGQGEWLRLPYPSYILYKTLAQLQGAESGRSALRAPTGRCPTTFAAPRPTI